MYALFFLSPELASLSHTALEQNALIVSSAKYAKGYLLQEACPIKYTQPIMCCFLLSTKHRGSSGGRQVLREVILKRSVVGDVFVCFSLQFLQLPEKKIMYIDDVAIRNY